MAPITRGHRYDMRGHCVLFVGSGAVHIGCGCRTDLFVVEESAMSMDAGADVAPKQVDRCAVYTTLMDCLRAGCEFYECGTGPVDADVMPMHFACASTNGQV